MIPLWNVEELEAVLPDDCRVERKSARIDVRRGRVTTRIMDNPTGGDGVLASRHTSYMDIDRIVLPEFDAKSIAAFVTGPLPQSERRLLRVEALEGVMDPDCTGGLGSVEYVRHLRDACE